MIKLTNILSELQVANPNISAEKVEKYWKINISSNKNMNYHSGWKEYKEICEPYCKKYNINNYIGYDDFKQLSKSDLIKIYNEMRVLVRKHVGKEILNELQIANPNITVEKVEKYYLDNIENKDEEFHPISEGWKEYEQICQPYLRKYNIDRFIAYDEFSKLSRPDLIKFYNEMRALVRKHVGTEILNELQVAPQIRIQPFRNNNFEKGLNVTETIINFIKANPFQPENVIFNNIALKQWYHPKVISDNIRNTLNKGVIRKQVINPQTKRKIWVYYYPQKSLF